MWEEVASQYNAKRERTSFVRDYDSLRRQFRSLVGGDDSRRFESPQVQGRGTIFTSTGNFDVAFGGEIWLDNEEATATGDRLGSSSSKSNGGATSGDTPRAAERPRGDPPRFRSSFHRRASSTTRGTYAANKRIRAKERVDQLHIDLDELEEDKSGGQSKTMRILLLLREEADRRTESEDHRRREDREERLAAERLECEEREQVRRENVAAAQQLRDNQIRRNAAAAAENRLRCEERLAQERDEARQRHKELMLRFCSIQRGSNA
ncbi:hypothetical protein JG687_00015254 [Phytophthora cactorum]|uniref:DUF6818 domain-containing protein n=2 Tax=Phytophthora cactorum TaxID=29920 RepID=A0A8T1TU84_9STRA|nr:hypothetical protein JG687_00015254 [Phytophthora cactorum]